MCVPLFGYVGSFERMKLIALYIAGIVSLAGMVVFGTYKAIRLSLTDSAYALWILVLLLASFITGTTPIGSIAGWFGRGQGVVFFMAIWVIGIWVKTIKIRDLQWLYKAMLIIYCIECMLMVIQLVFPTCVSWWYPMMDGRAIGTFGDPNSAGGYIAVSLPIILYASGRLGASWFIKVMLILLSGMASVASGSRIALICWALSVFGIACVTIWKRLWITYVIRLTAVVACSVVIIGTLLYIQRPISEVEDRRVLWSHAVQIIAGSPVIGYGAEPAELLYEQSFRSKNRELPNIVIDRSHNLILDILLWTGFIGLAVWIVFYVSLVSSIRIPILALGSLIWMLFAQFQPVLSVQWVLLFLYWAIGSKNGAQPQ